MTALLGTVRTRFTDSPLYSPRHPSCRTMSVTVLITPARGWSVITSPRRALLTILFCVWSRVRTTSCGYVVIEATIFDAAEQARNCLGVRSSDEWRPGTTRHEHMALSDDVYEVLTRDGLQVLI